MIGRRAGSSGLSTVSRGSHQHVDAPNVIHWMNQFDVVRGVDDPGDIRPGGERRRSPAGGLMPAAHHPVRGRQLTGDNSRVPGAQGWKMSPLTIFGLVTGIRPSQHRHSGLEETQCRAVDTARRHSRFRRHRPGTDAVTSKMSAATWSADGSIYQGRLTWSAWSVPISGLLNATGQLWRAASWTSCTRDLSPSLV
jgi:hypothetical protein